MSDLFDKALSVVPIAVVGASFLGSLHCVAMCGGLVAALPAGRRPRVLYHLGRGAGYLALGALAGALGESVLGSQTLQIVAAVAALLLGGLFIGLGIRCWRGQGVHLFSAPKRILQPLYRAGSRSSAIAGLLTALLPCGWLHTFVLGALATRSPLAGAGFLLCFWLGTLPALILAPELMRRILRPFAMRNARVAGVLLILAGVITVGAKAATLIGPRERACCHDHRH